MTAALTLTGLHHAQIEFAAGSSARRADILATTRAVTGVADAMDAEIAADALRLVSGMVKEVEASRVEIGKPVLDVTRRINALAKEFTTDLADEKARLERILGEYQAGEERKADAARRVAQDEADTLARAAAQAQRAADRAPTETDQEQAQQAAAQAETKAIEARVIAAEIAPTRPDGIAVRSAWKFEVTDIKRLFAARPDLCVIEPNNPGIRAQIPHNQTIPGLRIWSEAKASIR